MYDATKQKPDEDSLKYITTDKVEVYLKKGKYYDEMHEEIPFRNLKGRIKNGPCGHPTCSSMFGANWMDSSLNPPRLVCVVCANEKNQRAVASFGPETRLPCSDASEIISFSE